MSIHASHSSLVPETNMAVLPSGEQALILIEDDTVSVMRIMYPAENGKRDGHKSVKVCVTHSTSDDGQNVVMQAIHHPEANVSFTGFYSLDYKLQSYELATGLTNTQRSDVVRHGVTAMGFKDKTIHALPDGWSIQFQHDPKTERCAIVKPDGHAILETFLEDSGDLYVERSATSEGPAETLILSTQGVILKHRDAFAGQPVSTLHIDPPQRVLCL